MPEAGTRYLGFDLDVELGRGAFGRVFLARQADLAGRWVALKVARGPAAEARTLARLQHTNIVPVYSAHDAAPLQAVCMPFLGRRTLGHLVEDLRKAGELPVSGVGVVSTIRGLASATVPDGCSSRATGGLPPPARSKEPGDSGPPPGGADGGVWEMLARRSYADAVVWLGAQLAAGLAHAHARGILHRDIKPANVLLTDEGVPMLLDFNLAADAEARGTAAEARIGGTLPYMAPEQLEAFAGAARPPDARADLYALGVVLFELLTGRRPFVDRRGAGSVVVRQMLAERRGKPPSVREWNPHVPASVESIVHTLLAPDPAARYQSAADLKDDLDRHLADRPLKHAPEPSVAERLGKWARRHPRLTSTGSVAALAVGLLVALGSIGYAAREHARGLEARVAFDDHGRDLRTLQGLLDDRNQTRETLDAGIAQCRAGLGRYAVPADADGVAAGWEDGPLVRYLPPEDRDRLRGDLGELFFLMSRAAARRAEMAAAGPDRDDSAAAAERWNRLAEGYGGDRLARAVREQRADVLRLAGQPVAADRSAAEARATPPASARDRYLVGYWLAHRGRHREAVVELAAATAEDPQSFSAWFVRGNAHLALEQGNLAAVCFSACVALRPDFAPAWVHRGLALSKAHEPGQAAADFASAAKLLPGKAEPLFLRGGALAAQGLHADAFVEYTAAIACPDCPARVYAYRAYSREQAGDKAGAAADRKVVVDREPTDELSWIARSEARAGDDPKAALADVEQALRLNPLSAPGLQMKAHLLGERLNDPAGAAKALDVAVEHYPDLVPVRAGRGVLRARAGDRIGAHADAAEALRRDSAGPNLYQVGCIYALTARTHPADRFKAVELVGAALRAGFGRDLLPTDADLDPIRDSAEFKSLTGK